MICTKQCSKIIWSGSLKVLVDISLVVISNRYKLLIRIGAIPQRTSADFLVNRSTSFAKCWQVQSPLWVLNLHIQLSHLKHVLNFAVPYLFSNWASITALFPFYQVWFRLVYQFQSKFQEVKQTCHSTGHACSDTLHMAIILACCDCCNRNQESKISLFLLHNWISETCFWLKKTSVQVMRLRNDSC